MSTEIFILVDNQIKINNMKHSKNNIVRTNLLKITFEETKHYLKSCKIRINEILPIENANKFNYSIKMTNEAIFGCNKPIESRKQSISSISSDKTNYSSIIIKPMILFNNDLQVQSLLSSRKKNANFERIELTKKEQEEEKLEKSLTKLKNIVDNIKILTLPLLKCKEENRLVPLNDEELPSKTFKSCKELSGKSSNSVNCQLKLNIDDIYFQDKSDNESNFSFGEKLIQKSKSIKTKSVFSLHSSSNSDDKELKDFNFKSTNSSFNLLYFEEKILEF